MLRFQFSTYLFAVYAGFCLICLSWSADPTVRSIRRLVFHLVSPGSVPVSVEIDRWSGVGRSVSRLLSLDERVLQLEDEVRRAAIDRRLTSALEKENQRLSALVSLPSHPPFSPLSGRRLMSDPNDLFHSFMVNRGLSDGVSVSDPVTTLESGREVLVGRVLDASQRHAQVLSITDTLSAVSAETARTGEQGVIEGAGSGRLLMRYLFPDSDVRPGDEVVTAGLGDIFPEGVFIGTIETVEDQTRERFKMATVRPAMRLDHLKEVIVLRRRGGER